MTGRHHITLNDKDYQIRFNNFSGSELRNFFMKEGEVMLNESELTKRIIHKYYENDALLLKMIVYAGIVGYSYEEGFTPALTQKEVGKFIANANPEELFGIWRTFLEARGINLKQPEEDAEKPVKKKKKATKKNSK